MHRTLTLAQLGDWINPNVQDLPQPSLLQRYVLELPTLPAVALLVAGLIILIALRARARLSSGLIAFAISIILAAGIYLTGSLVQTEREKILDLQTTLIEATALAQINELDELLAEDARVRSTRLPQLRSGLSRAAILATVDSVFGRMYPVASIAIIERQAVIDGPNSARTQVYLAVQPEDFSKTWAWFAIDWRLNPDGQWRAIEIEPMFISGILPYNQ